MLPLPPLRFSMMTGWPHLACNLSPTIRATTSLVPPPGYGTRNLTDLVGYLSCANALLQPGTGAIDRVTMMKAKAAHHRTMGISVATRACPGCAASYASRAGPTCVRYPRVWRQGYQGHTKRGRGPRGAGRGAAIDLEPQ